MPYAIDIQPARHRVVVRGLGKPDLRETVETMRRLAADPVHSPAYGILADMRELDYVASFDDLIVMRDAFDELKGSYTGPIAVVVPDLLRYGIARTISGLTGMIGIRIEAFRELAEADAWLDAETDGAGGAP